jgi:hypothetical protein
MAATNLQVQNWSDQRTRVRAEQVRAVRVALAGDFNINNTAGGGADLRAATLALP